MPLTQILVRRCVRLNINPVVAHIGELFPCDRFSSAESAPAHAFGVDKQCKGIPVFFHDRPPYFVLRFPAVVESYYGAPRRYVLFATFPGEQILHRDHGDTLVFQLFHLRFKRSGRNLCAGVADFVHQPMVTKDKSLSRLIDDWLLDLGSCHHHRRSRRGSRPRHSGIRRLRLFRNGLLLFAHRKIQCQH